ncbi:cytochrome b/b6 domain-containing protein [Demequina silvatica]|uniref:cytochrome b/b6 domain-containing protein n=1 Tax=Demequina silvatica TaxID=1638988 RepID=UPI0007819ACB|nr:cytochrome b/b6 domain-containing protein [Demequina silvatica]
MTTYQRRGLPRLPGGEPWPPEREVPFAVDDARAGAPDTVAAVAEEPGTATTAVAASAAAVSAVPLRRGLPRVEGGEPWPAEGYAPAWAVDVPVEAEASVAVESPEAPPAAIEPGTVPLRRGLPRIEGGEPWPAAGFAPAWAVIAEAEPEVSPEPEPESPVEPASPAPIPEASAPEKPAGASSPVPTPTPRRLGRGGRAAIGIAVLVAVLGVVVLIARWLMGLDAVESFVADYPGNYELPADAPVGIPTWLSWQHFFNVFLIVLIARTGLLVRTQARPEAYWAPRSGRGDRMSLMAWTHQALDIFWVVNGAVYIGLLFITGQWMRIVPTDWAVIPNAISVVLQYASLDWPAENSWVYYNSLQQLGYFVTVFIASPLAIATGVRMSAAWRGSERLDRLYPKSVARALHFPVMLYFVAFVILHVGLVFATGARRNLNHMYAGTDEVSWVGLGIFALSLVVIVAAAMALRPLFIAPVAQRFGTVSSR